MAMRLATAFVEIAARQDQFRQQMGTLENDVRGRVGSLQGMLAKLAGAVGAGAALGASVKLAAKAESAEVAFNVMLKDMEKTKTLLADLNKFSIVTPFEPAEVRKAGLSLLAFKTSAEQIPETLQFLGDAAAGTGANFLEVVAVFNKVKAAGKLTGETFLQFAERGINLQDELLAMPELAGKSAAEFAKMRERGEISFDLVVKAMKRMTAEGGMFFDAMKKQSTTFNGLWSTVVGNVGQLGAALGSVLLPTLKDLLNIAATFTAKVLEINAQTDGLVMRIGLLTGAVIGLKVAVTALGGASAAAGKAIRLAMTATGVGIFVVAIGAAIAGILMLIDHIKAIAVASGDWAAAGNRIAVAWERIKETFAAVVASVTGLVNRLGEYISERFGVTWSGIEESADGFFLWLVDAVSGFVLSAAEWLLVLVTNWDTTWAAIKNGAVVGLLFVKDYFLQLPVWWSYALGRLARLTVDAFVTIVEIVGKAIVKVGEFMVDLFTRVWEGIKNLFSGGAFGDAFQGALAQMTDSVGRMGEALAAGWNKENPAKLWKSSPELEAAMQRQRDLLAQLGAAKTELEQESARRLAERAAGPAAAPDVVKPPEVKTDKVVANALTIAGGFTAFDEISKKFQEAALKGSDKDKQTNKLLETNNLQNEAQLAELKKLNENMTGVPETAEP